MTTSKRASDANNVQRAPEPAIAQAAMPARRIQEMVDVLRDRIASQLVPPGSKLLEQDLAEEFNAPRTVVREALSALEQRGLIERIPNRGAIVIRLDPAHVLHIYDTREVLEGLCARLATENVPPESWQDLIDLFHGPMERHAAESDFDAFITGYELFRSRLRAAAANPVLSQMLDSIYEKTQVLIRRIIILPGRAAVGLREHQAVLAAMRAGDAALAEKLRRDNMRSAKSSLMRYQKFLL